MRNKLLIKSSLSIASLMVVLAAPAAHAFAYSESYGTSPAADSGWMWTKTDRVGSLYAQETKRAGGFGPAQTNVTVNNSGNTQGLDAALGGPPQTNIYNTNSNNTNSNNANSNNAHSNNADSNNTTSNSNNPISNSNNPTGAVDNSVTNSNNPISNSNNPISNSNNPISNSNNPTSNSNNPTNNNPVTSGGG